MKVLITGSREHPHVSIVSIVLGGLNLTRYDEVIVGDNDFTPNSVDLFTRAWCEAHEIPCYVFEADWNEFGRAAGPIRNRAMVDQAPDVVFAFPCGRSRGTRNCIKLAREAGIKVHVIETLDN